MRYNHLPRQRKLSPEDEEQAKKVLEMKGNKKLLQNYFLNQGKKITLKDISNLDQKCRMKSDPKMLLEQFKAIPASII